ncbi:GH25 family lysozyme [Streptomyces prunicolor]|uniref:GH25 family lysozyme n=1 Tax=Streptomyces prunicolor TaxID=67348 RepID=UPI0033D83F50
MTIRGIDVSNYQTSSYSTSGYDFVIVKASEGVSYVNPKHAAQVDRARKAGLVVGHYHFVRDGSMKAQVDYFLKHAEAQKDEILALDWEDPKVSSVEKDEFLKYLKSKAGDRKVILYCNVDYWKNRDTSSYAADGLWIAQYNGKPGKPSIEADWLIHQYTSTPEPGVHLDVNVADFENRAAMAKWAGAKPAAKPKPKPKPHVPAFPGRYYFRYGAKNQHVTQLGKRLVAKGYGRFYKVGPGPRWTEADRGAVKAFQKAQGWTGKDADGYPGPETWKRLFS